MLNIFSSRKKTHQRSTTWKQTGQPRRGPRRDILRKEILSGRSPRAGSLHTHKHTLTHTRTHAHTRGGKWRASGRLTASIRSLFGRRVVTTPSAIWLHARSVSAQSKSGSLSSCPHRQSAAPPLAAAAHAPALRQAHRQLREPPPAGFSNTTPARGSAASSRPPHRRRPARRPGGGRASGSEGQGREGRSERAGCLTGGGTCRSLLYVDGVPFTVTSSPTVCRPTAGHSPGRPRVTRPAGRGRSILSIEAGILLGGTGALRGIRSILCGPPRDKEHTLRPSAG